jgi:hypothetical protein
MWYKSELALGFHVLEIQLQNGGRSIVFMDYYIK